MAKKTTGVAVQLGNRKWRFSEEAGAPMATEERATLVIGDERVFTESEVRAAILDVMGSGMTMEEKRNVLRERHGIVLNPA